MLEMKLIVSLKPFVISLYLVFSLVSISVFVSGNDDLTNKSRRISKRNELDMQFCVENFDIQEDTIIRTRDSRAMGAKYINESDLNSREECLKLCCVTTSCDVFVFDEKNPGSCYLFNCGPSDDFKCKFTHHRHYTSAILTVNRHAAESENEIQRSEQELTRLRVSANEFIPSTPSSPILISTVPPPPKETIHSALPANATITKPGTRGGSRESVGYGGGEGANAEGTTREKCSRYQFECRSTGECIAIYNACDGIPQCADGSDEGSELDCPSSSPSPQIHPQNPDVKSHPHNHPHMQPKVVPVTTAETHAVTSPPSPKVTPQALPRHLPPAIDSYQGGREQHSPQSPSLLLHQIPPQLQQFQPNWAQQQQQLQSQYHSMDGVNGGYNPDGADNRLPYPPQHLQQQQHIGYPGEDFPMAAGQPERSPMSSGNQWPPFRPGSPSLPSPLGQDWFPRPPMDGGNVGPQYEENGPNRHIFNHKGSGLVADTDRYIHMRIHPNQYNIPNYGDGTQGEYNPYGSMDNKGYVGGNENYFNTPYRQPVQPNWPLMHQQMASNAETHQMNENVKDLREEALRKHTASSSQSLASPNLPHGDYLPSIQSGSGERRPGALPLPPDYFYEDGAGGRHGATSPTHRGNNNQRVSAGSPPHSQGQKTIPAHHEAPLAQHTKEKISPLKGREEDREEEGEDPGEDKEEGSEEEEADESPSENKLQHSKTVSTQKPTALKLIESQHQNPVHMSLKHGGTSMNNEGNSDVPDGESSRPEGAILSLTLGMGITAIMVALMAWRLRVIKRRLRRGGGKSPYAHDADYLVNGMYL